MYRIVKGIVFARSAATGLPHLCEERSDVAIQEVRGHGLPRFARNDEAGVGNDGRRFARYDGLGFPYTSTSTHAGWPRKDWGLALAP